MIFKIYNCDVGFKYQDVNYDLEHVDAVVIEDPESVKLVRGANAKNKVGMAYSEGAKEPKVCTITCANVPGELFRLMETIYKNKDRVEWYCVDRTDGSSRIGKDSVLSQRPLQLTVDETPESMNVLLVFNTFNLVEDHKA